MGDTATGEGTGTAGMAPGEGDDGDGDPTGDKGQQGHVPVSCCERGEDDRLLSPILASPVPTTGSGR